MFRQLLGRLGGLRSSGGERVRPQSILRGQMGRHPGAPRQVVIDLSQSVAFLRIHRSRPTRVPKEPMQEVRVSDAECGCDGTVESKEVDQLNRISGRRIRTWLLTLDRTQAGSVEWGA